jgi:hypothetical protein
MEGSAIITTVACCLDCGAEKDGKSLQGSLIMIPTLDQLDGWKMTKPATGKSRFPSKAVETEIWGTLKLSSARSCVFLFFLFLADPLAVD